MLDEWKFGSCQGSPTKKPEEYMWTAMTNSVDDRLRDASQHREEFNRNVGSYSSRSPCTYHGCLWFLQNSGSTFLQELVRALLVWTPTAENSAIPGQLTQGFTCRVGQLPQLWTTSSCYVWSTVSLLVVRRLHNVAVRMTVVPTMLVYGEVCPRLRLEHVVKVAPTQISLEAGRGAP